MTAVYKTINFPDKFRLFGVLPVLHKLGVAYVTIFFEIGWEFYYYFIGFKFRSDI